MRIHRFTLRALLTIVSLILISGCNYTTHRTYSGSGTDEEDPEPNYDVTLEDDYQDFVSYIYMGNRIENFSTFFNAYYTAQDEFDQVMEEFRTTTIAAYNRRLDSLNINTSLSSGGKEKLNNVIKRASKIIQFKKNSRYLDDAVLLIGKAYFFLNDYLQAERKFNEFLSKLTKSELTDEARLFMGKTKLKLGKTSEGETILKNLIAESKDDEIKSEAAQDLGISAVTKRDYKTAVQYFKESIKFAKGSETKAEKQYVLAKIYKNYKPIEAAAQYNKVIDLTSDFDLTFFARLNYAKSLISNKKYPKAANLLEELNDDFREFPEYKGLVELEIANNLNAQRKYSRAMDKYYEVIVEYPGSPSAADAYYNIAKHYEDVKKDYFNALINFRKVAQENGSSDYATISLARVNTLDRYFMLESEISGNPKREIPAENSELEAFRIRYNEDKGINKKSGNKKNNEGENRGGDGKGMKGRGEGISSKIYSNDYSPSDTIKGDNPVETEPPPEEIEKEVIEKGDQKKEESGVPLKQEGNTQDTTKTENIETTTSPIDSLSIQRNKRFTAYFGMAELFQYSLGNLDSAEYYLKKILTDFNESAKIAKVMYALGTLYKNQDRTPEANEIFNRIIKEYPSSEFANESRKVLGMKEIQEQDDPAEGLYNDASTDIANQNYEPAVEKLNKIISDYPGSTFIPNTLYSLGWINENVLGNKETTIQYYKRLKDSYPDSEFYRQISAKLEFLSNPEGEKVEDNTDKQENNKESKEETNLENNNENEVTNDGNIPPEILEEIQKEKTENNDGTNDDEGDGRKD